MCVKGGFLTGWEDREGISLFGEPAEVTPKGPVAE